jgi:Acetolactate synthase
MNAGPLGVIGSSSANALAAEADVVLAIGTRLQDFTTGSWTVFQAPDVKLIAVNAARFDAVKHLALASSAMPMRPWPISRRGLAGYAAPEGWCRRAASLYAEWNTVIETHTGRATPICRAMPRSWVPSIARRGRRTGW